MDDDADDAAGAPTSATGRADDAWEVTLLAPDDEVLSWDRFGTATRELAHTVAEARTAVLYHKLRSVVVPDYVWRQTDQWIVFPSSAQPPVTEA